ncbi:N-acetylmuramoyl-L-alanine amidase family protein [Brumimicrobium mesophilum]|uniref:N-acetylmuramoyl-L-alanine amidase family protein n=1 Tax=Brumimicrobium mesophilum TaxID=392717 RepID=UPI00131E86E3|nr:N-acetylmuramoyl-L-alanine amidase [Brumimicrobium mesophilum]
MWSKIFKTIVLFTLLWSVHPMFAQGNLDDVLSSGIKTVVIDPGHGGKDPGCHGGITNEKTVVLAIGLKLGEYIKSKYPDINVIFTRDSDEFVELDQRAKIANEKNADVFISIHANAAGSAAYGTETYVLGLHRSESQQQVAERENSTILFEENSEEKYKDFELTPDAIIARQLQLSVFLNQSINLASKIQAQFRGIDRRDRGVKQAGFIVLYKTTMPSVLIETGFLTNSSEEKFLNDPVNQIKMANVIFKAFQEYVSEIEGVNTLVENGEGFEASIKDIKENDAGEKVVFKEEKDKVYFKVQVETSREPLSVNHKRFNNVAVKEYKQDGLYKYTAGLFENDFDTANKYKVEMQNLGFKHAFVVGFKNGERIPIAEAIKLAKQ